MAEPILVIVTLGGAAVLLGSVLSRKKKKKGSTPATGPSIEPGDDDPDLPDFPGPDGPKPAPGPGEEPDPRPTIIDNDVDEEELEAWEETPYNLYVSRDCETIYEGDRWYSHVFVPAARTLVIGFPEYYHHPYGVMWGLLVGETEDVRTPASACFMRWPVFEYSDRNGVTPLGNMQAFDDDVRAFRQRYPSLSQFLEHVETRLWMEPDLNAVFQQDWGDDEVIPFDPEAA